MNLQFLGSHLFRSQALIGPAIWYKFSLVGKVSGAFLWLLAALSQNKSFWHGRSQPANQGNSLQLKWWEFLKWQARTQVQTHSFSSIIGVIVIISLCCEVSCARKRSTSHHKAASWESYCLSDCCGDESLSQLWHDSSRVVILARRPTPLCPDCSHWTCSYSHFNSGLTLGTDDTE